MIRNLPFGNPAGFGEGKRSDEHFYSEHIQHTPQGATASYGLSVLATSDTIASLANIKYFADRLGTMYAVDSNGKLYAESTAGAGNFNTAVRAPGGTGRGLIGDQKGRLLYFQNTQIGKLEGVSTFDDTWKTGLADTDHSADIYEDMVLFANGNKVGAIYSDDSMALDAFELPSSFTVVQPRAGKQGALIGANLGYAGYLILWNPLYARSAAPWIPISGQIQSIERSPDGGWLVVTTKQLLWTNGYSIEPLFNLLDDSLGYLNYIVAPQGTLLVNKKLFILNQSSHNNRRKAGVFIFDLDTRLFEFVPVSTLNTHSVRPLAISASKASTQQILIGYEDTKLSKTYIAAISATTGTRAVFVSEPLGDGVNDKAAQAVILNLTPFNGQRASSTLTFDVSVKLYDFQRPLWGIENTSAIAAAADQLRVNGTAVNIDPQVGDEVTILEGPNAGESRHITGITNDGLTIEVWTVDRAFSNVTGSSVRMQVEPYKLVERKSFTAEANMPELFFNCTQNNRGKQFLVKVLIENANLRLTLQPSEFIYDDLGITT